MTFHTRASSRCHHRFHFMAGIFQRPGSICIFKTLLMAWENCIFPAFLGTTLLPSSPNHWASACTPSVPRRSPIKGRASPASMGDHLEVLGGQRGCWGRCGEGGHIYGQLGSMKLGPQSTKNAFQGSGGCPQV